MQIKDQQIRIGLSIIESIKLIYISCLRLIIEFIQLFFQSGSLSNKAEVQSFPRIDDNDFWEIILFFEITILT
ncbi:hypothetical protein pb186bvf_020016 [Paramecium bursaria]